MGALGATQPQKSMREDAAFEKGLELGFDKLRQGGPTFTQARISGLCVPDGMALHGQALGHSLLLGVPQENTRHRPLFLCESENWANEVLIDPVARAGIAAQASRGRGDQQVLNRAPAGRVVLLVNDFVLIAHHGNDDHDWGRKTLRPSEAESVFAHLLTLFLRGPTYCRLS